VRSSCAISGSAFSADAERGDAENRFFATGVRCGVVVVWERLGVRDDDRMAGEEVLRGVEMLGGLSLDGCALRGDLKGERKGFESVLAAASSLRLLAAGVDILIVC
jgi:hypothetical protein